MRGSRRLALALVLLAATGGLCVVEASTAAERWPYPTHEQVVPSDAVVGERVFLTGTVADGPGPTLALTVTADGRERTLTVRGVDPDVRPGGTIQVLGRLRADDSIDAERAVVVNATRGAEWRKWALSVGAVCLFGGLFLREWRVDLRALRVEARDGG